jgi:hypothetical protein
MADNIGKYRLVVKKKTPLARTLRSFPFAWREALP